MKKRKKQIQLIVAVLRTQFVFWLLFIAFVQEASAQNTKDVNAIRVMSYNIHYGKGMDGVFSLENIANVVKKADPDIVGLQEIKDSLQAEELGRLTGMEVVFGPSLGKSDGYGDAILSKYPFDWVGNQSIPSASSSRYQAMAVDVDLSSKSKKWGKVRIINTHFDWLRTIGSEEARLSTVDVIEKAFFNGSDDLPSILTADINSVPDSPVLKKLEKYGWSNYQDGGPYLSIPSTNPKKQIDYTLYRSNTEYRWGVTNFFVMYGEESSDHLPVVIDLVLIPL